MLLFNRVKLDEGTEDGAENVVGKNCFLSDLLVKVCTTDYESLPGVKV